MTELVRICPSGHHNPATEFFCQEPSCRAPLSAIEATPAYPATPDTKPVPVREPEQAPYVPAPTPSERRCGRGHAVAQDAFVCPTCGDFLATPSEPPMPPPVVLPDGWEPIAGAPEATTVLVRRRSDGAEGVLTYEALPATFTPEIQGSLARLTIPVLQRLLEIGRAADGRPFHVWEHHPPGALDAQPVEQLSFPAIAETLLRDVSAALAGVEAAGLRPPLLSPAVILCRSLASPGFVLSSLCSIQPAEAIGDLAEADDATELTRYSAPETFIGAQSATTAWWSLGVILLQVLTAGRCFEGLHDRAFLLSVVTHGLKLPYDILPEWRVLLRGLLTNDPLTRWSSPQVQDWLEGSRPIIDVEDRPTASSGPPIRLAGTDYTSLERFALAAADDTTWDEAIQLLNSGAIATWLQSRKRSNAQLAEVRRLASDRTLHDDTRLMLALLVLNADLRLCFRGNIVNENWIVRDAPRERANAWFASPLPSHLKRLNRESWFVRISERAERVRTRAKDWDIAFDDRALARLLVQSDTGQLYRGWQSRRRELPETTHRGLAHLLERRSLTDEDLIILLAAPIGTFRTAAELLDEAANLAVTAGVRSFNRDTAAHAFERGRDEVMDDVNDRLRGFARSGLPAVDEWADAFRLEGRITLAQALVLLSVPSDGWREPPEQQYIHQTLTHFQRRLLASIQHGPLARFAIGKTSRRIDITELHTKGTPALTLLQAVIERGLLLQTVDPDALSDRQRDQRLRRMLQDALKYRRETGINPLYFGFPFLAMRDDKPGETAKTRLLPILLWPAQIIAAQIVQIGFDSGRDDGMKVNPAIDGILGSAFAADVAQAAQQVRQSHPSAEDIFHIFSTLAASRSKGLEPLKPSESYKLKAGEKATLFSAAFFNCDFSAQTISEDLQRIASGPVDTTALATAIRTTALPAAAPSPSAQDADTFFVTDADPSQKAAVLHTRQGPGLVVQGPPGTGKSQTIVNIVSDCLARGERVLVVCQKQAALQVVAKRLRAEGLEHRFFMIEDATSDRKSVIQSIRDQVASLSQIDVHANGVAAQERGQTARRLKVVEESLDRMHSAIRTVDPRRGLTYRDIISRLIGLESEGPSPVAASMMQHLVADLNSSAITDLANSCAALAALWLPAKYEGNPLHGVRAFQPTPATCNAFEQTLGNLYHGARAHHDLLATGRPFVKGADPEPLRAWLGHEADNLEALPSWLVEKAAQWASLFPRTGGSQNSGAVLITALERLANRLAGLDAGDHSTVLHATILAMDTRSIKTWASMASDLDAAGLALRRSFSPWRAVRVWRGRKLVGISPLPPTPDPLIVLLRASRLELSLRHEREHFVGIVRQLGTSTTVTAYSLTELLTAVAQLLAELRDVQRLVDAATSCPLTRQAQTALRSGNPTAYAQLTSLATHSLAVADAREAIRRQLDPARQWIADPTLAAIDSRLRGDLSCLDLLEPLAQALPLVVPFQTFRDRARDLDPRAIATLAALRQVEQAWMALPPADLTREMRRTIEREALLAWKAALERNHPVLLTEPAEFNELTRQLGDMDERMRSLNRTLLSTRMPLNRITTNARWNGILNLAGANQRTLRQVVDEGEQHGLFHLRPIWLVNPEVASRIFPRRAGTFDVVVFDEASQLPVENALPALFRAKRFVVSGDEKQLPPTSFFVGRFDVDADDAVEDRDPGDDAETPIEATERERLRDRRVEVRDASDLLKLSQNVLPARTLQIHYRSKYRELIEFSNAAFYQGQLNIPARHPPRTVQDRRPIELHKVQSVYANQTNELEADAIVAYLKKQWRRRERPSIGVLTFNIKQADLIQEKIEDAAAESADFSRAYSRETAREENGEDHSFFVKNLENVQGDERDWIIFSTTFGPDADGHFRRSFGALSQAGGERRLNVAVTRAKEKIVIFSSMPIPDISDFIYGKGRPSRTRDYLQAYLDYAAKLSDGDIDAAAASLSRLRSAAPSPEPHFNGSADPFVTRIEEFLRQEGIETVRIADQDAFAFDLGILDAATGTYRLGIECDSPDHPLLQCARDRELWRPKVLKSAVPRIHRIWSRRWYDDANTEKRQLMDAVKAALT